MDNSCSFSNKKISQAKEHYESIEIQPGLLACTSASTGSKVIPTGLQLPGDTDYIHLNCLLSGTFAAQVKDVALECNAGDVVMGFSAGEVFHVKNALSYCNFELMIKSEVLFLLAGEEFSGLDFDKDPEFFVKTVPPCQRVMRSAMRINELMQRYPHNRLLLHSSALDYLYWYLVAAAESVDCQSTISFREKRQLTAAREYLLQDLSAPPTIPELAAAVGLNQCKLKKGFKDLFGSSIYAYFQKERMTQALTYLKNNNVTETAMLLGYSNVSHFSTAFRKQFGLLPKEARRELEPDFSRPMNCY